MKRVWRLNSTSYWLVGEHESWLSHMASKGYHLVKLNRVFSVFEKRKPAEMQYRIELVNGLALSLEQIELYEEAGWDYIESSKYYHVFSSPVERGAAEVYTDPTEQAITIEYLKKKSKNNLNITSVTLIFMIVLALISIFSNDPFLYWFINGGSIGLVAVVGVYVGNTLMMLKDYKGLKKLRKQLECGEGIDHNVPWRKTFFVERLWLVGFFLILICLLYIPVKTLNEMETITMPADTTNLPILRLEMLLDGQFVKEEAFYGDDVDWRNFLRSEWHLLAPIQYETSEGGYGLIDGEKDVKLEESLDIDYYEFRFELLVGHYLQSSKEYWTELTDLRAFVIEEHPLFEQLYVWDSGNMKTILAQWENKVVELGYSGQLTADEIIEEAAAFYSQF